MKRARSVTRTIQAGRNSNYEYDIPTLRHGRQVFELFTRVQSESRSYLRTFEALVMLDFGLKTARSKARSLISQSDRSCDTSLHCRFRVIEKRDLMDGPFEQSIAFVGGIKRDIINDASFEMAEVGRGDARVFCII